MEAVDCSDRAQESWTAESIPSGEYSRRTVFALTDLAARVADQLSVEAGLWVRAQRAGGPAGRDGGEYHLLCLEVRSPLREPISVPLSFFESSY